MNNNSRDEKAVCYKITTAGQTIFAHYKLLSN